MQRQLSWKKDCSGSKILITTMERKLATTTISGNLFRNKHIWLHLWNKLCSETVHLIAASTVFRNKNVICSYGKNCLGTFDLIWFDCNYNCLRKSLCSETTKNWWQVWTKLCSGSVNLTRRTKFQKRFCSQAKYLIVETNFLEKLFRNELKKNRHRKIGCNTELLRKGLFWEQIV